MLHWFQGAKRGFIFCCLYIYTHFVNFPKKRMLALHLHWWSLSTTNNFHFFITDLKCKTWHLTMKESYSDTNQNLDRNWVLKRKRRKLPCGTDKSSGREKNSKSGEYPSSTSSKRDLKEKVSSDHSHSKKKGTDGVSYFFFSFCSPFFQKY